MTKKIATYNSEVISKHYIELLQIKHHIDETVQNSKISYADLPASIIPTETLYMVAVCYDLMYNSLLNYQLIKSGNMKQTNTLH